MVPSLEVVNPVNPVVQPSDTITCKPRPTDGDRLWFFDGEGEPLALADDVTEAALRIAAGQLRKTAPPFGPVEALHAAVRRRYPQLGAACEYIPEPVPDGPEREPGPVEPGNHLRLRCGDDTRRIRWDEDAETYRWSYGPDKGGKLSSCVERAADKAAAAFVDTPTERDEPQ